MSIMSLNPIGFIGTLVIIVGLATSVIPILPGPILVWVGAFIWAWGGDFQEVGWWTLGVMGILAVAAWLADLLLAPLMSRHSGASWKSILGAIGGGILGAIFLSGIPILGTFIGAILGSVVGIFVVEYSEKQDRKAAKVAVRVYLSSVIVSSLIEMSASFLMVIIFIWQMFW